MRRLTAIRQAQLTFEYRLYEDDSHAVIEIRTDSLQGLRELGPPDLVSLIKQPSKSKQVLREEGALGDRKKERWAK